MKAILVILSVLGFGQLAFAVSNGLFEIGFLNKIKCK